MRDGDPEAVATAIRLGRAIQVWEVVLSDRAGKEICRARCTLAVIADPADRCLPRASFPTCGAKKSAIRVVPTVRPRNIGETRGRESWRITRHLGLESPGCTRRPAVVRPGRDRPGPVLPRPTSHVGPRVATTQVTTVPAATVLPVVLPDGCRPPPRSRRTPGRGRCGPSTTSTGRQPIIECMTSLAVVAAATHRTTVGSCVLQLPLHTPAAVAKQALSLQHLSGGRMVLGIGAGSHADEFERVGADFSTRGQRMDAGIAELPPGLGQRRGPEADYKICRRRRPCRSGWAVRARPPGGGRPRLGDGWIPLFVGARGGDRGDPNRWGRRDHDHPATRHISASPGPPRAWPWLPGGCPRRPSRRGASRRARRRARSRPAA